VDWHPTSIHCCLLWNSNLIILPKAARNTVNGRSHINPETTKNYEHQNIWSNKKQRKATQAAHWCIYLPYPLQTFVVNLSLIEFSKTTRSIVDSWSHITSWGSCRGKANILMNAKVGDQELLEQQTGRSIPHFHCDGSYYLKLQTRNNIGSHTKYCDSWTPKYWIKQEKRRIATG
jgi:hypothetical protein